MTLTVNINQAKDIVVRAMKARLVPMIAGSPGVGKSALIHQIAEEFDLKVIDLRLAQCDPTDMLGLPSVDERSGKASYAPMNTYPLDTDEVPEGYNGWLLFLDELTSAPRAVQAAAYRLILDRQVGMHDLHPNVAIVGAGNLETDNAIVEPMSTALQSRMVHVEVSLDHNVWLDWAMRNDIDHRITSYVKFKPEVLYTFHPDHTDKTYASPRTWEFASRLVKDEERLDHGLLPLLGGTISEGVAREFIQFSKVYTELPTIDQVIKDPHGLKVPEEPSILFALTGSIASYTSEDTLDSLMPYLTRLPKEFQVVCLREVTRRHSALMGNPTIIEWAKDTYADLA